jgi:AcrR family transcriptional regulator
MGRTYKLGKRAEAQAETRQSIVEAAIVLHQEKGVAATSISDIAERAGVGKVTVYRHFPDETALLSACSGQYFERHPFPDPEGWRREGDRIARLRLGLCETYAFHRETAAMMASVLPELREAPITAPYHEHWRRAAGVLLDAWPEEDRNEALKAALALALSFDAWRILALEQGLTDDRAVALMARLAE